MPWAFSILTEHFFSGNAYRVQAHRTTPFIGFRHDKVGECWNVRTYQQQQKNRDIVAILQSSVVLSVILGSSQIFIFFLFGREDQKFVVFMCMAIVL